MTRLALLLLSGCALHSAPVLNGPYKLCQEWKRAADDRARACGVSEEWIAKRPSQSCDGVLTADEDMLRGDCMPRLAAAPCTDTAVHCDAFTFWK